jgi:four helix bundle protein
MSASKHELRFTIYDLQFTIKLTLKKDELIYRTKQFGVRVISLTESLPSNKPGHIIADQILRAAFSVGANYRAACRAKSDKDFINKLKIVEEESDEVAHWIEMIIESKMMPEAKVLQLLKEANELTAIFVASIKTLRQKQRNEELKKSKAIIKFSENIDENSNKHTTGAQS